MAVKVAINGFGRIGRLVLRAIVESGRQDVVPVAINDLGSVEANAHLFAFDSVHGRFPGQLEISGDTITIRHNGKVYGPIKVSAERDPTKVPYRASTWRWSAPASSPSKEKASALLPGRRAQGADLGAGRSRRRHDRLWRQPQDR